MCLEIKPKKSKTLSVDALNSNLQTVTDFVDGVLEENGCPVKAQLQIDLCVEEIFVNIANYAYGDGCGKAEITVENSGGSIVLTFKDSGVPYNPLEKPDAVTPDDIADVPIGGLGILMAKRSVDDIRYERVDGSNIVTILKKW